MNTRSNLEIIVFKIFFGGEEGLSPEFAVIPSETYTRPSVVQV